MRHTGYVPLCHEAVPGLPILVPDNHGQSWEALRGLQGHLGAPQSWAVKLGAGFREWLRGGQESGPPSWSL